METNVNYTVVGIFVITLLAAIILTVLWLSSGLSVEQHKYYKVYMMESVSGLNIESPVEFNGVNVGDVKKIRLNDKNPQVVELLLDLNASAPVSEGTTATLSTRGITGGVFVALRDKGLDTRPLLARAGDEYPIIRTTPSLFVRLDSILTDLTQNLHQVSASIKSVLDPENQRSIKATLAHLDKLTGILVNNSGNINSIFKNSSTASKGLDVLIRSGDTTLNTMSGAASNFYQMSDQLKQNPSVIIRGSAPLPLGPGEE